MAGAGEHRTEGQRAAEMVEIAELYKRGWNACEIARKLDLSHTQIVYDLQEIRRSWRDTQTAYYDERKTEEIERTYHLQLAAWEAWLRSVGEKTKTRNVTGEKGYDETTTWEDAGDPRYLKVIHDCIAQRCKIWGLYAPIKMEQADSNDLERQRRRIALVELAGKLIGSDGAKIIEASFGSSGSIAEGAVISRNGTTGSNGHTNGSNHS